MRNFLLAVLCFVCVAKSYAQTVTKSYGRIDVEITKEKKPKRVYTKVEIKSAFPCGSSSWVQSLENKLNQSIRSDRRVKKGKYVVSVQFVVSKDSSIADVRCINDPGFGMSQEVVRAIKKCSKWGPSPYPGYPVRPYSTSSTTPRESIHRQDSAFQLKRSWENLKTQLMRYNDIALNLTSDISNSKYVDKTLIAVTKKQLSSVTNVLTIMDTADITLIQFIKPKYDSIFQSISVYKQIIEKNLELNKNTSIGGLTLQLESSLNRINVARYDFNKLCWELNKQELIWNFELKAVQIKF